LFGCYGASKTTIADIAREAEISVGAVYLDFASKEAVLAALSEHKHDALREVTERAVREAGAELHGALEAWAVSRTRFLCRLAEETHGCDLLVGCHSAVKAARTTYAEHEVDLIASLLRSAQTRGEIERAASRETARVVIDAFASLVPPLLERDEALALRRARRLAEIITLGLVRRPR